MTGREIEDFIELDETKHRIVGHATLANLFGSFFGDGFNCKKAVVPPGVEDSRLIFWFTR